MPHTLSIKPAVLLNDCVGELGDCIIECSRLVILQNIVHVQGARVAVARFVMRL